MWSTWKRVLSEKWFDVVYKKFFDNNLKVESHANDPRRQKVMLSSAVCRRYFCKPVERALN